jgi:glutathione S-transferase
MSDQPILHHFEASPFSEKIRIIFGFKQIAWQSSLIPRILPKPDLMPLTGGYRRTPVMQIGADVYCDTVIIMRELERRFPAPTLFPGGNAGLPWIVGQWTDRAFFLSTVNLVFGSLGDKVPKEFIEDRTKLRGAPFDIKAMTAALPHHRAQVRAHLAFIETQLKGSAREWLLGGFSLADVSAYMNVWYVRNNLADIADELLADFPAMRDWELRMRAIGHGRRTDISPLDALEIAARGKPAALEPSDAADPSGCKVGDRVAVFADEFVKTEIVGEVVSLSVEQVAIRRNEPEVGEVVVHFPRAGYVVAAR